MPRNPYPKEGEIDPDTGDVYRGAGEGRSPGWIRPKSTPPAPKAAPDTKAKQGTEDPDSPFARARKLTEERRKKREAEEKAAAGETTGVQAKAVSDAAAKRTRY